ncbi:hypothetical protein GCM10011608_10780 [Micromonospora sonchi]|uniref:Uncharacterized protein n=1 Tax=Micromonospora sonchi TaxID=1763543 RepID=A0A917WTR0_9ACTN|nr:hypothetical protein [Micromonospora sonchi]GGM27827.1 hypothetical protein GCM10011608_10780 [Micromonospora sonchi]
MTDPQHQIVALTDDDTTYYLLPGNPFGDTYRRVATWTTSAGDALTPVNPASNQHGGWHKAPGGVQDLTATQPGPSQKTGYRLCDPGMESAKLPATLPVGGLGGLGLDDDTATALYRAVYVDGPPVTCLFPAAAMIVADDAGAPPPDDGLRWVPNLRDELRRHRALHHLFPGHLEGFRQAVVDAAGALPVVGSRYLDGARVDRERPTVVRVSTEVPYEPHTTRFVRDTGRSGRKLQRGRTVTETKRLEVSVQVPDVIPGRNRAEARERWDAELASILDAIVGALTPAPCWHCQGTGVVARKDAAAAAVSRG